MSACACAAFRRFDAATFLAKTYARISASCSFLRSLYSASAASYFFCRASIFAWFFNARRSGFFGFFGFLGFTRGAGAGGGACGCAGCGDSHPAAVPVHATFR